ncbi:hypothetical protein C8J57DRAFT_1240841 [Mycena rebaudengoi]|nr:hypothetical protein C8J57DRAFT_1240841 [Mycena rebaudengoi]
MVWILQIGRCPCPFGCQLTLKFGVWTSSWTTDVIPNIATQALGGILAQVTLPNLRSLYFRASKIDYTLHCPRDHFAAFASRSSLHGRLSTLYLHDMTITEDDLVESLTCRARAATRQITLSSPIASSDVSLIHTMQRPSYRILHVVTLFTFDTDLLPDLITSRIFPGDREGRFEMAVGWMNDREPAMEASIITRIRKLNCGGKANYAGVSNAI